MPTRLRRIAGPCIAGASAAIALLVLVRAWEWYADAATLSPIGSTFFVACGLLLAIVASFRWPIHLRPKTKVYMSSVPYYLLAVLVPPPVAATVAGLGALAGEWSVRRQRGTTYSSIVTEGSRRVMVVWLGAIIASLAAPPGWHAVALVATAVILAGGDILTYPLVLASLSGEPPWRIIVAVTHDAMLMEGAQYLIGLLGAVALATQLGGLILLAVPTFLLYLAVRALQQVDQARHMAEEARRLRDGFLLTATHDLRTPLTLVLGRAALLDRLLTSSSPLAVEQLHLQVDALRRAAKRMQMTVEEMTDLADLQMGEAALNLDKVDIGVLVTETAFVLAGGQQSNAALAVHRPSRQVVVTGDRMRLRRALQHIVDIAMKYSPVATSVCLEVEATDEYATISVRIRGIRIPPADLPHLFEPSYCADTIAGTPGIGIGLASAKAIVDRHGGRIRVEITGDDETVVQIKLPCLGDPEPPVRSRVICYDSPVTVLNN